MPIGGTEHDWVRKQDTRVVYGTGWAAACAQMDGWL